MRIDLNDIPDSGFLEPGVHDVYIFALEWSHWGGSGNRYLEITFKDDTGSIHKERFTWVQNAMWKFKQLCIAAGYNKSATIDTEHLAGKKVRIHIKKEEYTNQQGEKNNLSKVYKFERCITNDTSHTDPQAPPLEPFDEFPDTPDTNEPVLEYPPQPPIDTNQASQASTNSFGEDDPF